MADRKRKRADVEPTTRGKRRTGRVSRRVEPPARRGKPRAASRVARATGNATTSLLAAAGRTVLNLLLVGVMLALSWFLLDLSGFLPVVVRFVEGLR